MHEKGPGFSERMPGPRAGINFIAYVSRDNMGPTTSFTCHKTVEAAEKRHGDLGRFYRGTSSTDYDLIVWDVSEAVREIGRSIDWIDWEKRIIHWLT